MLLDTIASIVTLIRVQCPPCILGSGPASKSQRSQACRRLKIAAEVLGTEAASEQDQAAWLPTATYERRAYDWMLQATGAREPVRIGRQIISSLIAEQVARHEYLNDPEQYPSRRRCSASSGKIHQPGALRLDAGELSRLDSDTTASPRHRAQGRAHHEAGTDASGTRRSPTLYSSTTGMADARNCCVARHLYLDVKRWRWRPRQRQREFEMTATSRCGSSTTGVAEFEGDRHVPGLDSRVALRPGLPCVTSCAASEASPSRYRRSLVPYTGVNCTLSLFGSTCASRRIQGRQIRAQRPGR